MRLLPGFVLQPLSFSFLQSKPQLISLGLVHLMKCGNGIDGAGIGRVTFYEHETGTARRNLRNGRLY